MSDTRELNSLAGVLAAAHTVVDELQGVDLTRDTDDSVLEGLRELERLVRRLDSVGYGLINDAQRRGLPDAHGCRSMGRFRVTCFAWTHAMQGRGRRPPKRSARASD